MYQVAVYALTVSNYCLQTVCAMPRVYKKVGGRPYRSYLCDTLTKAVDEIKSGACSLLEASHSYGIPMGTLSNHVKGIRCNKSSGGQLVFSADEEEGFVHHIITVSEWFSVRYVGCTGHGEDLSAEEWQNCCSIQEQYA